MENIKLESAGEENEKNRSDIHSLPFYKEKWPSSRSYSTKHWVLQDENGNIGLLAMLKQIGYSLGLVEKREKDLNIKKRLRKVKASPDFSFPSKDIFVRVVHQGGKEQLYQHAIPASYLMERNAGMCVAHPEVFKSPHESVLWPEELLLPGRKYFIVPCKDVEKLKRKYGEEGGQEILDANNTNSPSPGPGGHKLKENGRSNNTKAPRGHEVTENGGSNTTISPRQQKEAENGRIREPNEVGQEILDAMTKLSPAGDKIREKGRVKEENGAGHETLNSKVNQFQVGASAEETFCSAKDFYVSKDHWAIKKRRGLRGKKPFVPPLPKTRSFRVFAWQPRLASVEELSQ